MYRKEKCIKVMLEWTHGHRVRRLWVALLLALGGLGVLGGALHVGVPRATAARVPATVARFIPQAATTSTERGLTGLTAAFYDDAAWLDLATSGAYTAPIAFDLSCVGEDPANGCQGTKLVPELADGQDYSARWQGTLVVPAEGTYTFSLGEQVAACQPATLTLLKSGSIPCWPGSYGTMLECAATYTVTADNVVVMKDMEAVVETSNLYLGSWGSIGWWAQDVVGIATSVQVPHTQWIFNGLDFDAAVGGFTDIFGPYVATPGWYTRTIPFLCRGGDPQFNGESPLDGVRDSDGGDADVCSTARLPAAPGQWGAVVPGRLL